MTPEEKSASDAAHAFHIYCESLGAKAQAPKVQLVHGVRGVESAATIELCSPELNGSPASHIGRAIVGLHDGKTAFASFEPENNLSQLPEDASKARDAIMNGLGEGFSLWTRSEPLANALGAGDPSLNKRIEDRRIQEILRDTASPTPRF